MHMMLGTGLTSVYTLFADSFVSVKFYLPGSPELSPALDLLFGTLGVALFANKYMPLLTLLRLQHSEKKKE